MVVNHSLMISVTIYGIMIINGYIVVTIEIMNYWLWLIDGHQLGAGAVERATSSDLAELTATLLHTKLGVGNNGCFCSPIIQPSWLSPRVRSLRCGSTIVSQRSLYRAAWVPCPQGFVRLRSMSCCLRQARILQGWRFPNLGHRVTMELSGG